MCRIDGVEVDAAIQDKRAQAQAKRAAVVFQTPDPGGPLAEALADFVDDAPAFARKVHATRYAPLEEWYAALRDDAAPPPETQRRARRRRRTSTGTRPRALWTSCAPRASRTSSSRTSWALGLRRCGDAARLGPLLLGDSKFVLFCDSEYNYRRGRRMGMGGEVDGDVVHEDGERRAGVAFRRRGSGACAAAAWPCRA